MKKIAVLFALAALVTTTGCLSNGAQACIKSAECAGEADPAAFCQDAQDDIDADEDLKALQDACAAESDALAACLVASGTCDEVEGLDDPIFGVEATGADGACEDLAKANSDCFVDNA